MALMLELALQHTQPADATPRPRLCAHEIEEDNIYQADRHLPS